jgi:hypothetical protein
MRHSRVQPRAGHGGGQRPANAEAARIAPHKTRINPAAREVVSHLLCSRRKNDLVELALRMGVA